MDCQVFAQAGSSPNEDLVRVTESCAWVLDGTSGTHKRNLTGHEQSDGRWYVEIIDEYLQQEISDTSREIDAIVREAIEYATIEFENAIEEHTPEVAETTTPGEAVGVQEIPGAALTIIRWTDDSVEFFSLGDTVVLFNTDDGVTRETHGVPEVFDEANRETFKKLREEHPDAEFEELRARVNPGIQAVRALRETPGGYWAMGFNPLATRHAVTGEYDIDSVESVYLFTDGFDALVELYGCFDLWSDAVAFMEWKGIEEAVGELRAVEIADSKGKQYPRLKQHDDVGVARIEF